MIIELLIEHLEKRSKAKQRHLSNIKARDERFVNDPYEIRNLRFLPQDEGKIFTRTFNVKREENGRLWAAGNKSNYTNIIQRVTTFTVLNRRAVLISSQDLKEYVPPSKLK
jgi:hypothetical protein